MKEYLFIYPRTKTVLPAQYHFAHNLTVRLYDDLVWLLKNEEIQNQLNITIEEKKDYELPEDDENDIIGWLIDNDYKEEADELVSKQLAFAIVSDFCHFIFQTLHSSKKLKMTVAFHLLRKPFLENLLILEQLLVEEEQFLRKFEQESKHFDPGKISNDHKKELIDQCIGEISSEFVRDAELIFEMRYDKSSENSLYVNSNLATHLVTTRYSTYTTESQNMNFIFSGYNEWNTQLKYIYSFLPILLHYASEVIDAYFLKKEIISEKLYKKRKFYRFLSQAFQLEQFEFNEEDLENTSLINSIANTLEVKCNNCGEKNKIYRSDIYYMVHENYLLCKYCLADLINETSSFEDVIRDFFVEI